MSRENRHGPYPPSLWDQAYRRFAVRPVSPVTVVRQLAMLSTFTSLTLQCCLPKRPEGRGGDVRWPRVGNRCLSPGGAAVVSQGRKPLEKPCERNEKPRRGDGHRRPSGAGPLIAIPYQGLAPLANNRRPSGAKARQD